MKRSLLTFSALLPVVGLCVVAFAILNKHFWVGIGLLVIAAILVVFVYVRISKQITP